VCVNLCLFGRRGERWGLILYSFPQETVGREMGAANGFQHYFDLFSLRVSGRKASPQFRSRFCDQKRRKGKKGKREEKKSPEWCLSNFSIGGEERGKAHALVILLIPSSDRVTGKKKKKEERRGVGADDLSHFESARGCLPVSLFSLEPGHEKGERERNAAVSETSSTNVEFLDGRGQALFAGLL